jgi:hypothetical protein
MSKNESHSGGVGVIGLLGITFIVLKLVGVINWSWWWVTLPFWGFTLIIVFLLLVLAIINSK